MKKFLVLFSGIALSLVLFASCKNIGVGDAIDLEAPKVAITYPSNNDYVQKSFDLKGTASDNRKIEDIEVHYTYRKTPESEKITEIKHASISGSTDVKWVCHFDFSFDQEVSFTVYAVDHNRNESIDSSDSIVVVIDSEDPNPKDMLITRNSGFTTRTASIEKFLGENGRTATRNTDSANKDNFQNESIALSCNVKETYEIEKVYLDLYEITDYVSSESYTKTKLAGEIPVNENTTNLYNPEFTITQEQLNSYSSALASGLHYIMPEVVVIDKATNQSKPLASDVPYVFAWEAKYDVPKASLPLYYENGTLTFAESTPVPVIIFDDDGLCSYSYKLVRNDNPEKYLEVNDVDISDKNLRDHSFEINTKNYSSDGSDMTDGRHTLYITVVDQLTSVTGGGTRQSRTYNWGPILVRITNPDAPTINISQPAFNSIPTLVAGSDGKKTKFELKGTSLDNGEVKDIAIAWCRDGNSDATIKYFEDNFNFALPVNKNTKIESPDKNLVIWNIGRDGDTSPNVANTQYTDAFSKTFDIYTDFLDANNKVVNEVKVFVIAAKDKTDNVSTEVWRVGAFTALPKFKIVAPKEGGGTEEKTQTMVTAIPDQDYSVTITPESDSGLEITVFKVDDVSRPISGYTYTIQSVDAKSGNKKVISYYAEDRLGNKNEGTFTVQFDPTPRISDIICNQGVDLASSQTGDIIKKNGKLTLQVVFDRSVTITGKPKLTLNCYKNANGTIESGEPKTMELECITTGSSSSLTFEKEITEEVEYKKIVVKKNGNNWITLPSGATIVRSGINADLTGNPTGANGFKLIIDSKPPKLDSYSGARAGTGTNADAANFTRNASKNVDIKLNFSEPVTVQNGNIDVYMKESHKTTVSGNHAWHIPAVISADVFEKIWNNSSTADRIVLSGSATEKSVNGNDAYGVKSIVSAGPYKMYTNGLKLNEKVIYQYEPEPTGKSAQKSTTVIHKAGSVMVPDLTTKYVLDWQYDTASTNDKVSEIRAALERVGYHKTTIPLSRLTSSADKKTLTLTLKNSDFIDGIRDGVEYIMEIPTNAVVDEVQNVRTETTNNTYTFTVGKIATPVIRVNRWSTNDASNIAPSGENQGKARVKIDCETPGATIKYQVTTLTIASDFDTAKATNTQKNLTPPDIDPGDINKSTSSATTKAPGFQNTGILTGAGGTPSFGTANYSEQIEETTTYSASTGLTVGDGKKDTGQRIYIVARATGVSSIANLGQSEKAVEGAFKTVLYMNKLISRAETSNGKTYKYDQCKIHACQTPEGKSSTAGWPLSMRDHLHSTSTTEDTRDSYKLSVHEGGTDGIEYRWMSWELLSDDFFTITTISWNFQKAIDTLASYGSCIWGYELDTWGMKW